MSKKNEENESPQGELAIRVQAMPCNTNPAGDIFGGWVLSQMDIAGGLTTKRISKGRTVTIAVESMVFLLPVFVGDTMCCYVKTLKKGRTSIQVKIESWVTRQYIDCHEKVTEGIFTYVSVNSDRKPRPIGAKYK